MLKVLAVLLSGFLTLAEASNELKEMEYAEGIQTVHSVGKVTWLNANGKRFLTLYTETEAVESVGTVILLHPQDGHPNQRKIIKPLRTYLPKHKWASLSLQMPVLGAGAKNNEYYLLFDEAKNRIKAAVDFLEAAEVENIVLVGYGLGGAMATYFLSENITDSKVKALVTISLPVPDSTQKNVQIIKFLSKIEQPFLDIFAELDSQEVKDSARQRRMAAKANPLYRQFMVKGEGHTFQHDEGLLVKRVYSWINKTFRKGR